MAEATDAPSHGSDSPPFTLPPFFTNLFPFLKPKAPVSSKPTDVSADKEPQNSTVSFPYKPPTNEEPLKSEAEPTPGKTSNSLVIWQVYALGGFLVLKWAWARWNERNQRIDKKDKDDQPSNEEEEDDDDDQPSRGQA